MSQDLFRLRSALLFQAVQAINSIDCLYVSCFYEESHPLLTQSILSWLFKPPSSSFSADLDAVTLLFHKNGVRIIAPQTFLTKYQSYFLLPFVEVYANEALSDYDTFMVNFFSDFSSIGILSEKRPALFSTIESLSGRLLSTVPTLDLASLSSSIDPLLIEHLSSEIVPRWTHLFEDFILEVYSEFVGSKVISTEQVLKLCSESFTSAINHSQLSRDPIFFFSSFPDLISVNQFSNNSFTLSFSDVQYPIRIERTIFLNQDCTRISNLYKKIDDLLLNSNEIDFSIPLPLLRSKINSQIQSIESIKSVKVVVDRSNQSTSEFGVVFFVSISGLFDDDSKFLIGDTYFISNFPENLPSSCLTSKFHRFCSFSKSLSRFQMLSLIEEGDESLSRHHDYGRLIHIFRHVDVGIKVKQSKMIVNCIGHVFLFEKGMVAVPIVNHVPVLNFDPYFLSCFYTETSSVVLTPASYTPILTFYFELQSFLIDEITVKQGSFSSWNVPLFRNITDLCRRNNLKFSLNENLNTDVICLRKKPLNLAELPNFTTNNSSSSGVVDIVFTSLDQNFGPIFEFLFVNSHICLFSSFIKPKFKVPNGQSITVIAPFNTQPMFILNKILNCTNLRIRNVITLSSKISGAHKIIDPIIFNAFLISNIAVLPVESFPTVKSINPSIICVDGQDLSSQLPSSFPPLFPSFSLPLSPISPCKGFSEVEYAYSGIFDSELLINKLKEFCNNPVKGIVLLTCLVKFYNSNTFSLITYYTGVFKVFNDFKELSPITLLSLQVPFKTNGVSLRVFGHFITNNDVKDAVLCCLHTSQARVKKTRNNLTIDDIRDVQRKLKSMNIPPTEGWFFNGTSWVSIDGTASHFHPNQIAAVEDILEEMNREL
ncbi:hypothetical protein RCL1_005247 [Eukaryota sp. TZLM3-RCL]